MLNYNSVSAYQEIYSANSNMTKSKRYAAVSASRTPNLLATAVTTPRAQHTVAMKRKAYQQMWNDRSLQQVEPRLQEMMSSFLQTLGGSPGLDGWSVDVDLQKACEPFGFDATMVATLSVDPQISSYPKRRWMLQAASMAAWQASVVWSSRFCVSKTRLTYSCCRPPSSPSSISGVSTSSYWHRGIRVCSLWVPGRGNRLGCVTNVSLKLEILTL